MRHRARRLTAMLGAACGLTAAANAASASAASAQGVAPGAPASAPRLEVHALAALGTTLSGVRQAGGARRPHLLAAAEASRRGFPVGLRTEAMLTLSNGDAGPLTLAALGTVRHSLGSVLLSGMAGAGVYGVGSVARGVGATVGGQAAWTVGRSRPFVEVRALAARSAVASFGFVF